MHCCALHGACANAWYLFFTLTTFLKPMFEYGFFSSSSGLAGTAKSKRGMSADSYVSGDRAATHETPAVGSGAGELWRASVAYQKNTGSANKT